MTSLLHLARNRVEIRARGSSEGNQARGGVIQGGAGEAIRTTRNPGILGGWPTVRLERVRGERYLQPVMAFAPEIQRCPERGDVVVSLCSGPLATGARSRHP